MPTLNPIQGLLRLALLTPLLAGVAASPAPVAGLAPASAAGGLWLAPTEDAAELLAWLQEYGTAGNALAESTQKQLGRLLERVGQDAAGRSKGCVEARVALLTAAGWGLDVERPAAVAQLVRERAQAVLAGRLTPGRGRTIEEWILYDLLSFPDRYAAVLRAVGLRALEGRLDQDEVEPHLLVAVMTAGRDPDGFVRLTAADILTGRREPFVSDYFLGALERREVTPELFERHLASLPARVLDPWLEAKRLRLFDYVRLRLESPDWREASRALALAPRLPTAQGVPLLIQGLGVWSTRTIGGTKRIRHEYQRTLSRMTGHDYGLDATTWARWWQVAVAGGALPEAPPAERTEATFYGLRPASDRILFLIDRSGSMRERHEVRGTRFEDAVDRLLYTLRDLGPETRFGVVLFNARGHRFSAELEPADADTLERLERWATDLGPDGGTNLQSGLRAALPGLEQGELLPSAVPYDTVVVLCDGETESASWVAPWLAKYNLDARVVFHCVNIGGTPGGVLEALAGGSGGNFLSVAQD